MLDSRPSPFAHHCDGTCGDDNECSNSLRSKRAQELAEYWWTFALRAARRFHAATTTHDKTLAFRALRGVPRRTGEMALFEEARP